MYAKIIQATKGSDGEKKLAPGFITKFFRHFPTLHESATDAILDLIEDDDAQVQVGSRTSYGAQQCCCLLPIVEHSWSLYKRCSMHVFQ